MLHYISQLACDDGTLAREFDYLLDYKPWQRRSGWDKVLCFLESACVANPPHPYLVAERAIGWNVVSKASHNISDDLERDSHYLNKHGKPELGESVGEVAKFYRTIGAFASQGYIRMEKICRVAVDEDINAQPVPIEHLTKIVMDKLAFQITELSLSD